MALSKKTIDEAAKWGIDLNALVTAHADAAEKDFAFEIKPESIKTNFPTHSFLDESELNGLKGRLKNETLGQATELGIKALKDAAGITFEGKDPAKFLEAFTAKLNIPVDEKIKEKDKDISILRQTLEREKAEKALIQKNFKDREDLDKFAKILPANKLKVLREKEIRERLADDGYTVEDHEGRIVVKKNGEIQKDNLAKEVDPKIFIAGWMKDGNLLEAEAPAGAPGARKTFDTGGAGGSGNSKFDHQSAYDQALAAGGGVFNEKAQAVYTDLQIKAAA